MDTVRIELPSALLRAANLEEDNLSQEAARLLALELFREDKVSLGRAAELCETPLADFMEFTAKHGVAPLRLDSKELDEERQSSDRLEV
jgi:predicted HTH domain antitoxin